MRKFLWIIGLSIFVCAAAWASGFAPAGGGTECSTTACNLNASTTLNSKNICLADGTNCVASSAVNLSSVDQGIYPATDSLYPIGSSSKAWTALFADKASINTTATSNQLEVGGTTAAYSAYTCSSASCYSGSYYQTPADDWELGVGGANNVMYFYNTTDGVSALVLDSSENATFANDVSADRFISTLTTDRSVYGSTAKVGFAQYGTYVTSVEGITAGTSTAVNGAAILAVDGSIYTTSGSIGVKTASPAVALDVRGGIKGYTYSKTAYGSIATTANLTIANMGTADLFPVTTAGGAFTVTMYSDSADNGIPATDVGRSFSFYIITGGTNAMTIAIDSDLTMTVLDAITASSNTIEDVGDHVDCTVTTTDTVVCTIYEKD